MNPEEFEQQLRRQLLRPVPDEWRTEILRAASAENRFSHSTLNTPPASRWRELLWPCPQAWAGLAAVWLLVLLINLGAASPDRSPDVATRMISPSPEMREALAEQRRFFAELVGVSWRPTDADRPFVPRPRSERRVEIVCV